jgi:hypothetical protein
VEKPTCLETFAFIFYYPSALVGPSFDFIDFKYFIEHKGVYSHLPNFQSIKAGFIEFLKFLGCIGVYLVCGSYLYPGYTTTEEFANQFFLYKVTINDF